MSEAYAPLDLMSTENVSRGRWRAGLLALTGTALGGAILVIVLALGIADPLRAGLLVWQAGSAEEWPLVRRVSAFDLYQSPIPLPSKPFTIELIADNRGAADSAWGVWLDSSDGIHTVLVSNEGYFSVSSDARPHWTAFLHIQSDTNKLYVNIGDSSTATLRINDEIAWTGILAPAYDWGVVNYREPDLAWRSLSIYAR